MAAKGIELATAYVSIVPSGKGMKAGIEKELGGPLEKEAKASGRKSGKGFTDEFRKDLKDNAGKAGLLVSAALAKGVFDNLNIERSNDKLAAQLGLTGPQAKEAGKAAGQLYGQAYGESLGQVNEAIKAVQQNIGGLRGAAAEDLEGITAKVLSVSDAFEQDLGGTTAAVGQLIKTGLAKNADEALDVLTVGFQQGVDKSGDLLDTLNEYGTQFRKLGLGAKTATGILSQGLKAGARDADVVADALKEFSIRAIDGSKATTAGFDALGLSAEKMAAAVAGGGPSAANALQVTLDKLRQITDPVERSAAAVALFGTQAEDLGDALFALDPSKAVDGLGQVEGAAKRLDSQLAGNTATTLEVFKRQAEQTFQGVADKVGVLGAALPALGGLVTTSEALGPALTKVGSALKGISAANLVGIGAASVGVALLATRLYDVVEGAKAAKREAKNAAAAAGEFGTNDIAAANAAYEDLLKKSADARAAIAKTSAAAREGNGFVRGFFRLGPDLDNDKLRRAAEDAQAFESQARNVALRVNKIEQSATALAGALGSTVDEARELATAAGVDLDRFGIDQGVIDKVVAYRDGLKDAKPAARDLAKATKDVGAEAKTATEEIDAFRQSLDTVFGSALNLNDAQRRYAESIENLANSVKENGTQVGIADEKQRNLGESLDGVIEAAQREVTALAESGRIAADAAAQKKALLDRLEQVKKKFPELKGPIDGFIAKLAEIPNEVGVEVTVDDLQARRAIAEMLQSLTDVQKTAAAFGGISLPGGGLAPLPAPPVKRKRRAIGGPAAAYEPLLVGERGPERLVPTFDGYVLPNPDSSSGATDRAAPLVGVVNANGLTAEEAATVVSARIGWALSGRSDG